MLREPTQERSQRSLERLLDAAEELVEERGFEATSLRALCDRAGLTSGAFYARFVRKEDLILALVERLERRLLRPVLELERVAEDGRPVAAVRALLLAAADLYRGHPGLFRSLTSLARRDPEVATALRRLNDRTLERVQAAAGSIVARADHPRPELALRLGLVATTVTLRELVLERNLFDDAPALPDELLVDELVAMLFGYLEEGRRAVIRD